MDVFSCLPANGVVILGLLWSPSLPPQFDEPACVDLEPHPQLPCQELNEVSGITWDKPFSVYLERGCLQIGIVCGGEAQQECAGGGDSGVGHVGVL